MNTSLRMPLQSRLSAIGLTLVAICTQAATLVVTSNNDSGAGTLRQAIIDSASGEVISFLPAQPFRG